MFFTADDPAIARGLADGLTYNGYQVNWKSTGNDGLALLAKANQIWYCWMYICPMAQALISVNRSGRLGCICQSSFSYAVWFRTPTRGKFHPPVERFPHLPGLFI